MRFGSILFLSFLFSVSALAEAQDQDFHAGVNTFYRTDLTGDGTQVQIDLKLKDDGRDGMDNLTIHHDGKLVFELYHYDNPEDENGYGGDFEELKFVKLRKDGKTEILLGVHMSSDGGEIYLIEWDGNKFIQTLECSDRYELKDLDGTGDREVITFDRYEFGGPSIYSFDYSQGKYVLNTYEFTDYLKVYAKNLEEGKEEEKRKIQALKKGEGYMTERLDNLIRIYYFLGNYEKVRENCKFEYEEWMGKLNNPTVSWESLPSEVDEAEKYLDWFNNPQNQTGKSCNFVTLLGTLQKNFDDSALDRFYGFGNTVKKYRARLGLRTLAQKYIDQARAFYKQHQYEDAIAEYQNAIDVDPDNWDAYGLMGYSFLRNNQIDKAITFLEKSIEIDPAYGMGHYNLALAYWAAGQKENALGQVQKSVKVDPSLKTEIKKDPQFKLFKKEKEFREIIE